LPRLRRVENTPAGHRQIIQALTALAAKSAHSLHVILEATGGYEQPLVEALRAAHIRLSVVMPGRVRKFAQGLGQDAKTDAIDAALLSAYGQSAQPTPTQPLTVTERQVRALTRRRRQLLQIQTQERNRDLGNATPATVRKGAAKLLALLQKQIAEIDRALRELEKADAIFQAKITTLCTIEGVGRTTATATLAAIPELGSLNRAEAGSLAGLAPKNRDSGQTTGRRFIRGGRSEARQALYMAAVSAARCNPVLRPFYERLRQSGKAAKLALTAVMRRLLIHMNSLLKSLTISSSNLALQHAS
jgi:transposase